MKENTQEKNLIEKKENGIFGKIKKFFRELFGKKQSNIQQEVINEVLDEKENNSNFKEYIKMTEDEESKLLELQRKYHNREIDETVLTNEQIDALCELYDKQIAELEKTIEIKEQKLAEYKKRNKHKIKENNA